MILAYVILVLTWLFVLATSHAYHHYRTACQLTRRNADLLAVIHEQRRRLVMREMQRADAISIVRAQDALIVDMATEISQRDAIISDQVAALRVIRQQLDRMAVVRRHYRNLVALQHLYESETEEPTVPHTGKPGAKAAPEAHPADPRFPLGPEGAQSRLSAAT